MTLHDAYEILGIDPESNPDQARRAYLRLIKKHKPEIDPEGFRRVREAYEIAAALELRNVSTTQVPSSEVVPPTPSAAAPASTTPQLVTLAQHALQAARDERADEAMEPACRALDLLVAAMPESPIPTLDLLTQTVLWLERTGHSELAEDLRSRLAETFHEWKILPQRYSESLALRWLTVMDLPRLPASFPGTMRREIIDGALEGEVDPAVARLEAFCEENPHLAFQSIYALQQAPSLAGLYTSALRSPSTLQSVATESPSTFEDFPPWAGWLAFPLFYIVLKSCIGP